jgi:hypothetical protein
MKKIYVLTYSSYSHEDHDLYSETIGIFQTEDEAREKMKQDIEFGLVEDNDETMSDWDIETTHAEFDNDYYSKRYKIDYCYLDK